VLWADTCRTAEVSDWPWVTEIHTPEAEVGRVEAAVEADADVAMPTSVARAMTGTKSRAIVISRKGNSPIPVP
jgi:hypothetical protein